MTLKNNTWVALVTLVRAELFEAVDITRRISEFIWQWVQLSFMSCLPVDGPSFGLSPLP